MIRTHVRWAAALFLPFALATCVSEPPGAPSVHLTIQAAGEGSGLVLAGEGKIYCSLPARTGLCDVTLPASAAGMVLTASAVEGSQFTGWRPASAGAPEGAIPLCADQAGPDCTLDFRGGNGVVVRPRFELPAIVAVSILGEGSVTGTGDLACAPDAADPDHCRRSFATGTLVALTASGPAFNGWSAPCDTAGPTCHVTAEAAQQIVAYFGANHPPVTTHVLAVDISGLGSGTVRSLDDGGATIDCSAVRGVESGRCTARLPVGAALRLAATADPSWILFSAGPGGCAAGVCTILLDADTRFRARFEPATQHLSVTGTKEIGVVSITSDPAGIGCTVSGNGAYTCGAADFPYGSGVALRADLSAGAVIAEDAGPWRPCGTGQSVCATLVLTADEAVALATVTKQQAFDVTKDGDVGGGILQYRTDPAGMITTTGGPLPASFHFQFQVDSGSQVHATVILPDSLVFLGWSGECTGTGECSMLLDRDRDVHYRVGRR